MRLKRFNKLFGSAVISDSVTTFMTSRDGSAYMMKPSISKLTMYDGFFINRRSVLRIISVENILLVV